MPLISGIIETLATFAINVISQTSYPGVIFLMAVESANIPVPSEIIMPFAGFIAAQGGFNIYLVSLAGAVGCTLGSLFSYWLGRVSHEGWIQGFVRGWGRFILNENELEIGRSWFQKYGDQIIFISRLLPVVRTFISFPAGVAKVNLTRFIIYTFVGSLIWSYALTLIGYKLGENWESLGPIFRQFDYLVALVLIIGLVWFLYRRVRHS